MFNYKLLLEQYNPKVGDDIILSGNSSLYIKNGSFQFYVNQISLAGQGNLWAQFEKLKRKEH